MAKIPNYVNCNNKRMLVCDFYILKECPNTCIYSRSIKELGIGAICDGGLIKKLEDEQRNRRKV